MAISLNELKSGLTVLLEGQVYAIANYHHVKPGKGAAFVRVALRNLKTSAITERTFKGDQVLDEAFVVEKKLQYLYRDNELFNFIDQENFEQVWIPEERLGENSKFLKDNLEVSAYFHQGEVLNINLPTFVELKVIYAEPGLKGDTAGAAFKSATLETQSKVNVPLFIKEGDVVKIDTRTGEYAGRK